MGRAEIFPPGMSCQDTDRIGSRLSTEKDILRMIADHDGLVRENSQGS